jgi:hypothetical protein
MDEACGRDNEGCPPYVVELAEVDLAEISPGQIRQALESCGGESGSKAPPLWVAEACHSYGLKAPLGSWEGGNAHKLLREARGEANQLRADPEAREAKLDRPVNAIGSTAREFNRGDLDSALTRGVAEGNPHALLMRKMEQACALPCCGGVNRLGGPDHRPGCHVAELAKLQAGAEV